MNDIGSITTIKINPYEIAKAEDLDIGFRSILHNFSLLLNVFTQADNDFIIGGDISVVPNQLKIKVSPYIAFCKKTSTLYCNSNETIVNLDVSNSIYDRIDVICVGGDGWTEFQTETRAKWNTLQNRDEVSPPITAEEMLFGTFKKRQKQNIEVFVVKGVDNDEMAKKVQDTVIKIAEIKVIASRTMLGTEDVHSITAVTDGEKNISWTQELNRTFYIAPMKEAIERYFKIHKKDGDLKNGVVKSHHLSLTGDDALTAMKIQLGGNILRKAGKEVDGEFQYSTPFANKDAKLQIQIFTHTSVKKTLDLAFDTMLFLWNVFVEQGYSVYYASKQHTDNEITETKEDFYKKLAIEHKERVEAVEKEKTERVEAVEKEKTERIEAVEKEKTERIEAVEKEKTERIEAVEKEKDERIRGDAENRKLAQEAYKFALPIGTFTEAYSDDGMDGFLKLDGESFEKDKYPLFYEYWKQHLSEFGTDYNGKPILPFVETKDYSRLGEIATFIGTEYHDEFLICDGSPFSPDVYKVFYEKYWKKYLSHLGTDYITGWPLRPCLKGVIAGTSIYIKVLPQFKNEFVKPFIKTGE